MHPAFSVIFFTSASGFGFGLLAWLGFGRPDVTGGAAFAAYFLGYGLAVGGLLSSVFHLGNKKNAVKAFSQWQSSWLSREGVSAIAALLAVAPFAFGKVFLGGAPAWLGVLGALLCLFTVFTTSMIYAQLKTVPRWHTPLTPVMFMSYAVGGPALLTGETAIAVILLALAGLVQFVNWMMGDGLFAASGSTMETATGLGTIGKVKLFEPPHNGGNYLLNEMGYRIGRKHAQKLRGLGIGLAFVLPILLVLVSGGHVAVLLLAVICHLVGVFATRWLFFAEAKHVVSLYYGH